MSAAEKVPICSAEAGLLLDFLARFPVLLMAASGGPDSTALLWLVARWRNARKRGPALVAVTVDHGLRAQAKREAQAVARLARSLGVAHRIVRWTGNKPKTGIQEAAREARYRLLADAARQAGAEHVLTAHTLDDQAETVLFRLARGSGVSGLAGMRSIAPVPVEQANGVVLVRPLLAIPKSRLIATLEAAKIPYADDPSNRDPRFARPRLRAIMPALAPEGLTPARLGLLARRVERVEDALSAALADIKFRIASPPWPENGPVTIAARAFFELPEEFKLRLLDCAIAWTGDEGPVELGKLEPLVAAMIAPLAAAHQGITDRARFRRTLAGALVTLAGDKLTVERAPRRRNRALKRP